MSRWQVGRDAEGVTHLVPVGPDRRGICGTPIRVVMIGAVRITCAFCASEA